MAKCDWNMECHCWRCSPEPTEEEKALIEEKEAKRLQELYARNVYPVTYETFMENFIQKYEKRLERAADENVVAKRRLDEKWAETNAMKKHLAQLRKDHIREGVTLARRIRKILADRSNDQVLDRRINKLLDPLSEGIECAWDEDP